ncbi:response regulator transcription factor [Streptomyces sp. SPB4]|uniref:response regulator transcription factor n=1 Tax=Streptomyces TaxID=1883 RepID=UPI0024747FBE|nr:response regulator transcription factor [Streptomyces sp. SPB4]MDH6544034.1 DNA-binding NarL/FixJ family response regulator [Streptomyces sp. SPB4]
MIRVLVTDDEPLVRFGLRVLLDTAEGIEVIGEAGDGVEALPLVHERAPDLLLTDLRMPRLDGIALTRRVLALPDPPAVVVLTTFDTYDGVTEALRAGARGYLLKDAPPEQVIGAVHVVAAGGMVLAPASADRLTRATAVGAPGRILPEQRHRLAGLSEPLREVLSLIGEGLSNAQIAQRTYLTEGSVKAYVSRLLSALKLENRTQAAILAHQAGLIGPRGGAASDKPVR